MGPRRAAEALALLEPRIAIPIHWGTYRLLGARPPTADAEVAPDVQVALLAPDATLQITPR